MSKEAEGLCWLWGDVMSANCVSPAEQLPLRQHKHRPSLIPHLTLCRNISQRETVCPQDFRGVKSIFAFHECKNKLIRGNRCMLNLDIPTVELFMQWFIQRLHVAMLYTENPLKRVWFKAGTWAASWTERAGPSHVWIIPKMTYPSRTSLSLAGHFLFRSSAQVQKKICT